MLNSKSEFRKLLAASFISQSGSHFLTIALSAFILMHSKSVVLASLVFVFSFLPSVLVSPKLGHWVDNKVSRWLIARNELISIVATILCGLCIYLDLPVGVLCVILGFRSILLFIGRAAAIKWLKLITQPEIQAGRIKLFYLAFFLSTAVSGILAAQALNHLSIWTVVIIDSISYLGGLSLYLSLKQIKVQESSQQNGQFGIGNAPTLVETLTTIFSLPALRTSFLVVCLSQAIFQGAYSVLVSYLPIKHFNVGASGLGWFQIAASIGITVGFLVNWFAPKFLSERVTNFPFRAMVASFFAMCALVLCVNASSVISSLIPFLVLNLAYECIWLHHNSEFFRGSPIHHAARYQFTLAAVAAFVMAITTLAYSFAIESLGLFQGVLLIMITSVIIAAACFSLSARPATALVRNEGRS